MSCPTPTWPELIRLEPRLQALAVSARRDRLPCDHIDYWRGWTAIKRALTDLLDSAGRHRPELLGHMPYDVAYDYLLSIWAGERDE
jgi:hypothetical protein